MNASSKLFDAIRHRAAPLLPWRETTPLVPATVRADAFAVLEQHRSALDDTGFFARLLVGFCLMGYLMLDAFLRVGVAPLAVMIIVVYLVGCWGVRIAHIRGFKQARWVFAALDLGLLGILQFLLLPVGVYALPYLIIAGATILLPAYAPYGDLPLISLLAVGIIVLTGIFLALASAPPVPGLFLAYLVLLGITSVLLARRYYVQILRHSLAFVQRTQAVMTTSIERAKRKKLEELNQLKRDFIASLAHAIRPIYRAPAPLPPSRSQAPPATQRRPRSQAAVSSDNPGFQTRRLNKFLRMTDLFLLDSSSPLRWNVLLADLLQPLLKETKPIPIVIEEMGPMGVLVEPRLMCGAILALLHRAAEASTSGKVITLGAEAKDQEVVLRIHDPDSHFSPAHYRPLHDLALPGGHAPLAPKNELELILAQHAIRSLGGHLHIESTQSEGTTVYCTLPGIQAGKPWLTDTQLRLHLEGLV